MRLYAYTRTTTSVLRPTSKMIYQKSLSDTTEFIVHDFPRNLMNVMNIMKHSKS